MWRMHCVLFIYIECIRNAIETRLIVIVKDRDVVTRHWRKQFARSWWLCVTKWTSYFSSILFWARVIQIIISWESWRIHFEKFIYDKQSWSSDPLVFWIPSLLLTRWWERRVTNYEIRIFFVISIKWCFFVGTRRRESGRILTICWKVSLWKISLRSNVNIHFSDTEYVGFLRDTCAVLVFFNLSSVAIGQCVSRRFRRDNRESRELVDIARLHQLLAWCCVLLFLKSLRRFFSVSWVIEAI